MRHWKENLIPSAVSHSLSPDTGTVNEEQKTQSTVEENENPLAFEGVYRASNASRFSAPRLANKGNEEKKKKKEKAKGNGGWLSRERIRRRRATEKRKGNGRLPAFHKIFPGNSAG